MPSERREITFCHSEFCTAVKEYLSRPSSCKVNGDFKDVILERAPSIIAIAEFVDREKRETLKIRLGSTEIGAVLTLYCISHHIPLPKQGEKAVQMVADNIALVITLKAPKVEIQIPIDIDNTMESSEEPVVLAANP